MSVRDQSAFRPEPTTTGVVDAVAALLGPTLSASCCTSKVLFPWLVGDSFGADHDGRGRRRRSASWPHAGRQLLNLDLHRRNEAFLTLTAAERAGLFPAGALGVQRANLSRASAQVRADSPRFTFVSSLFIVR